MSETNNQPCPWCGHIPEGIEYQVSTEDREGIPVRAVCPGCGATSPSEYVQIGGSVEEQEGFYAEAAASLWNNYRWQNRGCAEIYANDLTDIAQKYAEIIEQKTGCVSYTIEDECCNLKHELCRTIYDRLVAAFANMFGEHTVTHKKLCKLINDL